MCIPYNSTTLFPYNWSCGKYMEDRVRLYQGMQINYTDINEHARIEMNFHHTHVTYL